MTGFIIHFLICNLLISGMIVILFAAKKILKAHLTSRTQYNLWFLPLCLMAAPFISIRSEQIFSLYSWFAHFKNYKKHLHLIFTAAALLFPGTTPALIIYAESDSRYQRNTSGKDCALIKQ